MKKNVAAVISAMGALLSIVTDLVAYIRDLKGDVGECIYRLAQPEGKETLKAIAELLVQHWQKAKGAERVVKQIVSQYLITAHNVILDFSQTLEQMIAAGGYDWKNIDITADNFPVRGLGQCQIRVELLHFNQHFANGDLIIAKLQEVNTWLASQGANYRYRFAFIQELLALGAAFPDLQLSFPIAAFGSIWRQAGGYRLFAYLDRSDARRSLSLRRLGHGFHGRWRFAVVREAIQN
ncbi:MAG: hypothetical protein WC473_01555 [Patescibacteria group bacterium]